MNQLQKEILQAIDPHFKDGDGDKMSNAAAEVCLRWIEKGLRDSTKEAFKRRDGSVMTKVQDLYVQTWKKDNGLTE